MYWPLWHSLVALPLILPQHILAFELLPSGWANLLYPRSSSFSSAGPASDRANARLRRRQLPFWQHKSDGHWSHKADEDFFHFVTRPDIGAPKWDINVYDQAALAPGYWFVAPYAHLEQVDYKKWNGPHIYDQNGQLVWSGAPMFDHFNTFDFRTVEVNGTHKFASLIFPEDDDGGGVIIDSSYDVYKAVNILGDLPKTNMHDFTVVNDGTRALTLTKVFENASREESRVIGFDGECRAGWEGFKELDVDTSEILFDWSAEGHIGLDESTKLPRDYQELCSHGWDMLHLNSIDKFPDGDYLLSSRHTDAVYKISHTDGEIVWRLGGVKSDFEVENDAKFSRQHHARVRGQNDTHIEISLFDNTVGDGKDEHPTHAYSRGLLLSLDLHAMTASMQRHYDHPRHRHTNSRGSLSFLPNGNAFLGWTYGSLLSEHSADGRLLMDAHFHLGVAHTYRAYKLPWYGRPSQPPDVVSTRVDFGNGFISTLIHVSWNGATNVVQWKAYHADSEGRKRGLMLSKHRDGFETLLWHNGEADNVIVEAMDAKGTVLGRSKVIKTVSSEAPPPEDDSYWRVVWSALSAAVAGITAFCVSSWFFCTWSKDRSWMRWRPRNSSVGYESVAKDEEDEGGESESAGAKY